jgi:hypothetical protein
VLEPAPQYATGPAMRSTSRCGGSIPKPNQARGTFLLAVNIRKVGAHGILSGMRKRSTKKPASAGIGEVASGIVAAAEQDIELTAEQLEHAAERLGHAAAAAVNQLRGLESRKPLERRPKEKHKQTAMKPAKVKSNKPC